MPDDLYDRDFPAWREQQATLLARLAAGDESQVGIDWDKVILGAARSETRR